MGPSFAGTPPNWLFPLKRRGVARRCKKAEEIQTEEAFFWAALFWAVFGVVRLDLGPFCHCERGSFGEDWQQAHPKSHAHCDPKNPPCAEGSAYGHKELRGEAAQRMQLWPNSASGHGSAMA